MKKKQRKNKLERSRENREYTKTMLLSLPLIILPAVLFIVCVVFLFPPVGHTSLMMYGIFGMFGIGSVLSYSIYSSRTQRNKRIITRKSLLLLGLSSVITMADLVCLYVPSVATLIPANSVAVYTTLWMFLFLDGIFFLVNANSIHIWLRRRKNIRKVDRSWRDMFWYTEVRKEHNLGFVYGINIAASVILLAAAVLHLSIGWIQSVEFLVCMLTGIGGLMDSLLLLLTAKLISDVSQKRMPSLWVKNRRFRLLGAHIWFALFSAITSVIAFGLPVLL